MEMDQITVNSSIPILKFYGGQSIFITGATGFLGKLLIEKILRSCPDIREIFLLMRPKKELTINERLDKILESPLYDRLRKEQPLSSQKLIPVLGDSSTENLGLSPTDRQMLSERVTIVFHLAASVKFNDTLKYAILTNARATRDVCILAENMKNLMALIYVGTAFAQIDKPVIEEKLYPPIADWRKMIKIAESVDEHILYIFTSKCLNNLPNTYIFSKNLSESIIREYSSSIPCAILRPSIVITTVEEPFSGWIDNFNGPVGLIAAGGKGILRVVHWGRYLSVDMIPADAVIKSILLLAWKIGSDSSTPESAPIIINCANNGLKDISNKELIKLLFNHVKDMPLELTLWSPNVTFIENFTLYYICVILLHVLPAVVVDFILRLFGHKPMLVKLQRKIYVSNKALKHIMLNKWKFDNTNFMALSNLCTDRDFSFRFDYDLTEYYMNSTVGMKKFLLREDMNRLAEAGAHNKRLDLLAKLLKVGITLVLLWIIFK